MENLTLKLDLKNKQFQQALEGYQNQLPKNQQENKPYAIYESEQSLQYTTNEEESTRTYQKNLKKQNQLKNIQYDYAYKDKQIEDLKIQLDVLKNDLLNMTKNCQEYEKENKKLHMQMSNKNQLPQLQQNQFANLNTSKEERLISISSKENFNYQEIITNSQAAQNHNKISNNPHNHTLYQPLVHMQLKQIYDRKSLSSLIEEYKHNPNIKKIITDLQLKFDSYRSVRGDGNCYFRAVGFAFLEHLVRYTTPIQHLEDFINKMESNIGYYQVRSKSHSLRSNFLSLLQNLKQKKEINDASIQQYLIQLLQHNQHDYDEALIWQMRSLTANYLESHQEYFLPFCQVPYEQIIRNVLTMGKEADGIGIGPLQVVLKVKIEIVTIDRNYQEVLSFDQMKIAGKCPLIFILYKPGHYDIIYSKDQSKVDGFDEIKEQYTNQVQLPQNYNLHSPRQPFFVEIEGNGQECPTNEFKAFEIKYDQAYQSTGDSMQSQVEYIETEKGINPKIQRCEICQLEIEKIQFIELQCHHYICNYCLQDQIEQDTGGKILLNSNEKGTRANCLICKRELTEQEIERIVGNEKFNKAKRQASYRIQQQKQFLYKITYFFKVISKSRDKNKFQKCLDIFKSIIKIFFLVSH